MRNAGSNGCRLPCHDRSAAVRLPHPSAGLRIGLLGGSFNPAHAGHRHVSMLALRQLRLDRIWWLVTPGNPLKDGADLAPLDARIAAAREAAAHPRIHVTDLESSLGTRFTYDLLSRLVARCSAARFVWIMGGDNLLQFHRWRRWRAIADLVPIAVIDRPGATLRATHSRAGLALAHCRLAETEAGALADRPPPAIVILHGPRSNLSSTAVRAAERRGR